MAIIAIKSECTSTQELLNYFIVSLTTVLASWHVNFLISIMIGAKRKKNTFSRVDCERFRQRQNYDELNQARLY